MGRGVVLVAERPTLFPLFAAAAWATCLIQRCRTEPQETILKIVEGAHPGHVLGFKATDEGIPRLLVEALDPDFDRGDVTLQHEEPSAQHIVWALPGPTVL
jgi:hypothetical protein